MKVLKRTFTSINVPLIFVTVFFYNFWAQVDARFYLEVTKSLTPDGRTMNFRLDRAFVGGKYGFFLYACDTPEGARDDEAKVKCKVIHNLKEKQQIYGTVNFNGVTKLESMIPNIIEIGGRTINTKLQDVRTVGYDLKAFHMPLLKPVCEDMDLVEAEVYVYLSPFVDIHNYPAVQRLLRFGSVNNVGYFFVYSSEAMSLFETYEATLKRLLYKAGYDKEEFWQLLSRKFSSSASSFKDKLTRLKSKNKFVPNPKLVPQLQPAEPRPPNDRLQAWMDRAHTMALTSSISRFLSSSLSLILSSTEPVPQIEPDEDIDDLLRRLDAIQESDDDSGSEVGSESKTRSGSGVRSSSETKSQVEDKFLRQSTAVSQTQPTIVTRLWSQPLEQSQTTLKSGSRTASQPKSKTKESKTMSESLRTLTRAGSVSQAIQNVVSGSITKSQPSITVEPGSQDEDVLAKYLREAGISPTRAPPRAPSDILSQASQTGKTMFSLRVNIVRAIGYLTFRMFDPCFVLNSDIEGQARVDTICALSCQFFGMTTRVYGINFSPNCAHLKMGKCVNKTCQCDYGCSFGSKKKTVSMVYCNNALRQHIYEQVVKYEIKPLA